MPVIGNCPPVNGTLVSSLALRSPCGRHCRPLQSLGLSLSDFLLELRLSSWMQLASRKLSGALTGCAAAVTLTPEAVADYPSYSRLRVIAFALLVLVM